MSFSCGPIPARPMNYGATSAALERSFGLRELGFKAQLVGHTETGIATVVRDFLPARMKGEAITKFARLWASEEEVDAIDTDLTEHFCSPAELGWAHTINLEQS